MKKFKFNALVSMFLIVGMSMTTSCGKGTDVSDKDEVGKFELTVDGKTETGTKVFNGAAIGIRTISAKNANIDLGILLNEDDFKAGKVFNETGSSLSTLKLGDAVAIIKSGTIKVVSKSKIELTNCIFQEYIESGTKDIKVSGYISSK
jgi:hypothetical protein